MQVPNTISEHTRKMALMKVAFPSDLRGLMQSPVGTYGPHPTTSDVLNAINIAQTQDIGTPQQRMDAFGRVINSGLTVSSPAWKALKAIGGGVVGGAVASMITSNPFAKGLGIGIGANIGLNS